MIKQYINIPMPTRPSNPSALEMAIYNYEIKAREFHNEKNYLASENECTSKKSERIEKRNRDWNHLMRERRRITAHVIQQEELERYRAVNKDKSVKDLAQEKHHPTSKLARNLRAVGEPKPTVIHEAHHIIPGKGRHLKAMMAVCRLYGIGTNDPVNGVWLRNFSKNTSDDWATPEAPPHRPLHTKNYEEWISSSFSNDNLPETVFGARLCKVKHELKSGTHPSNILVGKE